MVNCTRCEKNDISLSKPMDVFIYTAFKEEKSQFISGEQIYFAENISEAAAYIKHIFLYDILNELLNT